ncbi:DEAD/DEAH box helicase [Paraburkholderia sp. BR10937]|uniref:DEAD/DEAH box helicase n=1 Tax=Paraburkholderia sp. BR10937 TaxID=3236994 RepID=UPI0034D17E41
MTKKLLEHLARSAPELLRPLLGAEAISLIERVGSEALTQRGLAYMIVSRLGENRVLRDPQVRGLVFDTLEASEADNLVELLELPPIAARMTLNHANFDTDIQRLHVLEQWYGIASRDPGQSPQDREGSRKVSARNILRPDQLNAYRELRRIIGKPPACALVHMPVGAGKLRLVSTAILDMFRSEPDGRVIVWFAPGEALCEEAFRELTEIWEQLGSRDVTIYRLYGNRPIRDLEGLENCIVIADIVTFDEQAPGLETLGSKASVIVLADAENVKHSSVSAIVEKMSASGATSVVGILASPTQILDFDGPQSSLKRIFNDSCVAINGSGSIGYLGVSGGIRAVTGELFELSAECSENEEPLALNFDPEYLDRLSKDVERNQSLLKLLVKESKGLGRLVFFATTAEHAKLFVGFLALYGVDAVSITAEESMEYRKIAIQKFNAREQAKVLCVHGFLLSGNLVPNLSTAIIAVPTLSKAVFLSMVGRLLDVQDIEANQLRLIVVADSVPDGEALVKNLTVLSGFGI